VGLGAGDGRLPAVRGGRFFYFSKIHQAFLLVRGLFVLAFFLYLVRQETRERLH
jgi:hypothetical protein